MRIAARMLVITTRSIKSIRFGIIKQKRKALPFPRNPTGDGERRKAHHDALAQGRPCVDIGDAGMDVHLDGFAIVDENLS